MGGEMLPPRGGGCMARDSPPPKTSCLVAAPHTECQFPTSQSNGLGLSGGCHPNRSNSCSRASPTSTWQSHRRVSTRHVLVNTEDDTSNA
eukprot:211774-Rhodomonas_salina.1